MMLSCTNSVSLSKRMLGILTMERVISLLATHLLLLLVLPSAKAYISGERGICSNLEIKCQCGINPQNAIPFAIEQCQVQLAGRSFCKPCEDINPEKICLKYRHCQSCIEQGCSSCPPDKTGVYCENDLLRCPLMLAPEHGHLEYEPGTFRAFYTCEEGYELVGNRFRDCTADGQWTGLDPRCDKICIRPKTLEHGTIESLGKVGPLARSTLYDTERQDRSFTFACDHGFVLMGADIVTCLPTGDWSASFPHCVRTCGNPGIPEYGQLIGENFTAGATVSYRCNVGYHLIGNSERTCMSYGHWNGSVPECEMVQSCEDPGTPSNMQRMISGPHRFIFFEGARLSYECHPEEEVEGSTERKCLTDGTWSGMQPRCIRVLQEVLSCNTRGHSMVGTVNIPVKVACPSGCYDNPQVWGTGIYSEESQVCASAIHAGKITNRGGMVLLVKNGYYSPFLPSISHGISSFKNSEASMSFRFEDPISVDQEQVPRHKALLFENSCPIDWQELQPGMCTHFVHQKMSWDDGLAHCDKMQSNLFAPINQKNNTMLTKILREQNVHQMWVALARNNDDFLIMDNYQHLLNKSGFSAWAPDEPDFSGNCVLLMRDGLWRDASCSLELPVLCYRIIGSAFGTEEEISEPFCNDPGDIKNGQVIRPGLFDYYEYHVGTRLRFLCNELHTLKGPKEIMCQVDGTWTAQKPTCIRATVCSQPKFPKNMVIKSTTKTEVQKATPRRYSRNWSYARRSRLPEAYAAPYIEVTQVTSPADYIVSSAPRTRTDVNVVLPPGYYRPGDRMTLACESEYYRLVGSETRTCLKSGDWSGRQPSCIPACGKSSSPRLPFIVNGSVSQKGQWPWHAGIASYDQENRRWELICGGVLVSENYVVTAAHCITYLKSRTIIPERNFRIYLGKYYRNDSLDDKSVMQQFPVEEIHIHDVYDAATFSGDIALMRLSYPATLTQYVQPVCLPDNQTISDWHLSTGSIGVITGWGRDENNEYPAKLQQTHLPVVPNEECESKYTEDGYRLPVTNLMFCAGFGSEESDSCAGDSGGPMVFSTGSGDDHRWILEGIVSWGSPQGCAVPQHYGGYTRVSKFVDWIRQYI